MDHKHDRYWAIRKVVREELRDMVTVKGLRKNGDTWPGWLMKVFTLDRIVGGIALIFLLGQKAQVYTGGLDGAVADIKRIVSEQMAFRNEVAADIADVRRLVEDQKQKADAHAAAESRLHRELEDRLSASITRGEVNQMTDQIIRRLDRIERTLTK